MYKLTVLFISSSKKSAIVKIEREFGFITSTVAQGFMSINQETKVGATLELPLTTNVSTIEKTSTDKETGELTKFNWVVLD